MVRDDNGEYHMLEPMHEEESFRGGVIHERSVAWSVGIRCRCGERK